ncbi:hypothetical protein BJI47_13935 [Rhodococcus sp. 1168]|nr:hypothetical protein BJI47_13935 [Rhodococcus sp. 1168]
MDISYHYRHGVSCPHDDGAAADAVQFLQSDRALHITMQSLYVGGGATLRRRPASITRVVGARAE